MPLTLEYAGVMDDVEGLHSDIIFSYVIVNDDLLSKPINFIFNLTHQLNLKYS